MPYVIEWGQKEVYCKFTGEVSGQDLIGCNMSMYGSVRFDDIRIQIFDMLDVSKINFTSEDVKKVAALDRAAAKNNTRLKCALVSTDEVALGQSKIYQNEISDSPWEGKSFRTISEAREWASKK